MGLAPKIPILVGRTKKPMGAYSTRYARALNPDNPYLARTDPIEDGVYIRHRTPWGMRTMNRYMQGNDTLDEAETTSKKGAEGSSRSRSALDLATLPFAATAAATSAAASSSQK